MAVNLQQLKNLSARKLIAALQQDGFLFRRQDGSHQRYVHPDGREIDTHVLDSADGAEPVPLWNTTHVVPGGGLQAFGVVAGKRVRCISAEMQRLAHEGYELPPKHLEDMRRLAEHR